MMVKFLRKLKFKFLNSSIRRKIVILNTLLVTITPSILIATFAITYYRIGADALLNAEINKALDETLEVSELYIQEHRHNMEIDIKALRDIIYNNEILFLQKKSPEFALFLNEEAKRRKLDEIIIFTPSEVIAKNALAFSFSFMELPFNALSNISSYNQVIPIDSVISDSQIRLVMAYDLERAMFIMVGKHLEKEIIDHVAQTKTRYSLLTKSIKNTQAKIKFALLVISLTFASLSIYFSIKLAHFIARPLKELVEATEYIKQGDYSIRVQEKPGRDETSILSRAFNKMTETLRKQRSELTNAHDQINERRRFIELVLSEISSGVIILSPRGRLVMLNRAAKTILQLNDSYLNKPLKSFFKELLPLFAKAKELVNESVAETIELSQDNKKIYIEVRINSEVSSEGKIENFIITLNNITELVSAQRSAAWADVARRIAHEIKNPLTPITLAIERLNKKYLPQISEDKDSFERYISTISTHINTIWRIVEDFVNFARIPAPKLERCNINNLIGDAIFTNKNVHRNIRYVFDTDFDNIYTNSDPLQITQVFTNLLKNSAEAIEARREEFSELEGLITVKTNLLTDKQVKVEISDNGVGLPDNIAARIFEPYVTTKVKGTGLGLAIVKKIIEDHNGVLKINNLEHGASISFTLPIFNEDSL
jgi:two-component system nitrogen regulation sensor histidine kinase NtrY